MKIRKRKSAAAKLAAAKRKRPIPSKSPYRERKIGKKGSFKARCLPDIGYSVEGKSGTKFRFRYLHVTKGWRDSRI